MKKNMVPLLAIAFVVAIISTGLFYGLFASKLSSASAELPKQNVVVAARKLPRGAVLAATDVQVAEIRGSTAFGNAFTRPEKVIGSTVLEEVEANQVLTKNGLTSTSSSDGGNVPAGMRAITIHVLESGGVLALLRPGSRVDVQAISDRNNAPGEAHTVLRTVLHNIEVLSSGTVAEQVALRFSAPPVTVLVRAEDSDLLAVADAGARLRLALRNRLDEGSANTAMVTLHAVFAMRPERAPAPPGTRTATAVKVHESVPLWAHVVAVSDKGAREISSSILNPLEPSTLHVTPFRMQGEAESLVQRLESQHDLAVLSSGRLRWENGRPVLVLGGAGRRLSIAIHAGRESGGGPVLEVQPFVSWPEAHGVATRSLTAELPEPVDAGFLISGLTEGNVGAEILKELAPERESVGHQLMVIVTRGPSRAVLAMAAGTRRN